MKFSEEDYKYFSGEKFSNGYQFKLQTNPVYSRQELLLQLVKDKSILHVGCCDHIPLIKEKVQNKTWLHGLLEENCSSVVGVDINKDAIEYVNSNSFAKSPVYFADITDKGSFSAVPQNKFDSVLLGEIVEHVDNPVDFLSRMKTVVNAEKCIITVPNAFSFLRKKKYSKGIEGINSDHRYWFSPYTIAKVMQKAGIKPLELLFCNMGKYQNGDSWFTRKLFCYMGAILKRPFPYKAYMSDQMVVIGELQ